MNVRKTCNILGKRKIKGDRRLICVIPMTPRVIAISGKMKGTVFALSEEKVSIGRDATNTICLDEPSVSRRHCQIERDDNNRFFIHDLESFNGIFVNGIPVSKQEIKHCDQLGIGDVILFFLSQDNESEIFSTPVAFIVEDDDVSEQSTIKLVHKDAVYTSLGNLFLEFPNMARAAKDLSALLQLISMLNLVSELDDLQDHLLDFIGKVIPAERGAILFTNENDQEIVSHYVWSPDSESSSHIPISKTIVDQCLKEQVSILHTNMCQDEKLQLVESLAASRTQSVLCSPLRISKKPIGVIYLSTSDSSITFDENHLQLLVGVSDVASRPLENAMHIERLKLENQRLLDQLDNNYMMIGESARMREVFNTILRIAPTDSNVLISGESGTGKELAARSVHQNSYRSAEPFVAINCATLTENLLESELFGHERGAFTGAFAAKRGQFEAADRGTIFLDEIGELAVSLQAKLLRVLQEREIMRVGSLKAKKIDVRIIAATNKNLEDAVKGGTFREDLYYRLNVINLVMPPLRERLEDLTLLVRFFLNTYNQKCKRNIKGISSEVKTRLQNYPWPGNVRELENVIERAVILATDDIISLEDLPEALIEQSILDINAVCGSKLTYHNAIFNAKKKIIEQALSETGNNVTKAAESLGIHPNNLHRLIKQFDLRSVE